MLNFKKLFVLLLAFVLLSCTFNVFADTNYTMEVNFYNYDDSTLSNPIIYKGSETFYGYVEVEDNTTHETYWSYKQLSLQSDGKTWKTQLTDFWAASTTAGQKVKQQLLTAMIPQNVPSNNPVFMLNDLHIMQYIKTYSYRMIQ